MNSASLLLLRQLTCRVEVLTEPMRSQREHTNPQLRLDLDQVYSTPKIQIL
jgi:hypothetical protein